MKSSFSILPPHLPPQGFYRSQPRLHWLGQPVLQITRHFCTRGMKNGFIYNALHGHALLSGILEGEASFAGKTYNPR